MLNPIQMCAQILHRLQRLVQDGNCCWDRISQSVTFWPQLCKWSIWGEMCFIIMTIMSQWKKKSHCYN